MSLDIRQRPSVYREPPEAIKAAIKRSASNDEAVARAGQRDIAKALELPLRKVILAGDVTGGIYEPIKLEPDAAPEFPLDILAPGVEKEHVAYTIPSHGRIPERCVEGDYIMVPTFEVGSSIDWPLKLAQRSRWDVVARALEIFEAGFVKKNNTDAWHTLLAAAADRRILVYDANAGPGRFTLRLLSLMNQAMRRNAGGNTTSLFRGKMTDWYGSIEALEDMRNWTLADVTASVRDQIFVSEEGFVNRLFNINLHEMIEFGVGQEYQAFYLDTVSGLSGTLAPSDVELCVGLDLQRNDSFINPIRNELEVFEDGTLHRQRRSGVYGWTEHGWAVLDNRRLLLGSM